MTIITESILQFNETCINRISTYIMSYLKPTLGEKIYDPCMYNGECIVAAIKYMNYNHDYNINWKKMKDYINGTSDDYTFINNARNNILNATYEFRDDLYVYTHSNNYNFNNTLQYIYNINGDEKYDIIVSRIYSYNIHLMNLIFNSMKNNCRCAIIVDDIFLFLKNEKYKNIRKKMINTMNVTEIVSIGNSESIIFFDNKCITNNISFYNLDNNNIEKYESNLSYEYISLNNYELFDDTDMPSLVSYTDMPSLVSYNDIPSLVNYINIIESDKVLPLEIVDNNISTIVEKRKDAIIIGNNVVIVSFDSGMVHIMSEKAFICEKGHNAIENIQRKTFGSNQEDEYIAFEIYAGRIKINTILETIQD